MESSSFMSFLSQTEKRLGDPFRKGQREIAERFVNSTTVTAQLPTGLGKTRAAAIAYAILKNRGLVNRVLYIVPRGQQARQAAEEFPRDLTGILQQRMESQIIGDTPIPAMKAHRLGTCEIFITTIQALVAEGSALRALRDMMGTATWFIIIDEHQHYGEEDRPWTTKVRSLPHQALLAMSATPYRKDLSSPFGVPDVVVRYQEARALGYVKELDLHAYDYRVDAMVDGTDVETFTTSQIYEAAGSSDPVKVDRWVALRELRWSPRYISPLVKRPIARLMSYSFRAQMIVQAISCSHAKMICEQIKSIVGPDIRVDWVGTGPRGRTDADNERILQEFCPTNKDANGNRPWTLDILVNVGIAGEGLDSIDVCEVVFLNAPNLNNATMQAIGRAARPPKGISPRPIGIISVDEACEMAAYVGNAVETCFDAMPTIPTPGNGGGDRNGGDYPLPPDVIIKDTTGLVDIRTDPHFAPLVKKASESPTTYGLAKDEIEQMVEEALREGLKRRDAAFNQSAAIEHWQRRVENGCRLKAFQVEGMLKRAGRMQIIEYQDIVTRIKARKNRQLMSKPKESSAEELQRHWKWLEAFQEELKTGVPSWLS